jgi:O-acetyl-ADP-ribose deacetylase (regulator of RNase III)
MNTWIGKTALEIVPGDITELEVDAIANAANNELHMGAGVAGAIKRVGGAGIELEAVAQGPIEIGSAVATTGGALKSQWVIHAAVMGTDLRTDAGIIARATTSVLETADRCHARSLALPAFGTGVGGFPLYACANIMLGQVRQYLTTHKSSGLRRIVFSVYDDSAKAAFKNAMAGLSRF